MDAIVIDFPTPTAALERSLSWPAKAHALAITDGDSYVKAGEYLQAIKSLRREVTETFQPMKRAADQAKKQILEKEREADAPLAEAERVLKDAIVAYDTEQERIRIAEERRLQAEAQTREEERRIAEAAAMEAHALATDDPALLLEAEDLVSAPVVAAVVTVEKATPRVAGMAFRETWGARVTDLQALVGYVAAHPEQINLLQANQTALNSLARSLKRAQLLPGVAGVCTRDVAARGR